MLGSWKRRLYGLKLNPDLDLPLALTGWGFFFAVLARTLAHSSSFRYPPLP